MQFKIRNAIILTLFLYITSSAGAAAPQEVAPGVFFRLAEGGCNVGWVIFDEYVLVIDSNFPHCAEKDIEAIRQTTDKPIRFVFVTHHHLDHAWGNAVYANEGAAIIAQRECAVTLRTKEAEEQFKNWAKDRPKYLAMGLKTPDIIFDDELVFDDGKRRVELLHFGHGHTKGDSIAYLPHEKIVFTGDLCVNGVFNYLGESNPDNWIRVLSEMQEYEIKTVCPGHGPLAGKELLATQQQYFIELRDQIQQAVNQGKTLEETRALVQIPMYKEWTGQEPRQANIDYMYRLKAGLITPWELVEVGLYAGDSPTKDTPGWTPPKKMLTRSLNAEQLAAMRLAAPNLEFINVRDQDEMMEHIGEVDAVMGPISEELFEKGKQLRWVNSTTAGVSGYLFPEFVESETVLTNGRGVCGPPIGDHILGYMLMFSKGLAAQHERKLEARWGQVRGKRIFELSGKTLLILGFGGIGQETAKRAQAFGMRILAVDPQSIKKPHYVSRIVPPDEMESLLPEADFVACCVPLTKQTDRYFGKKQFELMKPTAYFMNVGRGRVVDTDALVEALRSKTIAGAAVDVTDPEPLPSDHPLWKLDNVLITPHMSGRTEERYHLAWLLLLENTRRFAAGEPLLNVVNKKAGY